MGSFPRRTFVSVDEAVAILLKRLNGPCEFDIAPDEATSDDLEEACSYEYSLREDLEHEKDELLEALGNAKQEQDSEKVKAAREALKRHTEVEKLAYKYQCYIEDELSKGDDSALRTTDSGGGVERIWIMLPSLDNWALSKGFRGSVFCSSHDARPSSKELNDSETLSSKDRQEGPAPKGGLSRTRAENLYLSYAFLIEEFIKCKVGLAYSHEDGRPNVSRIASHLFEQTKVAAGGQEIDGVRFESIENHIKEAFRVKKLRIPPKRP